MQSEIQLRVHETCLALKTWPETYIKSIYIYIYFNFELKNKCNSSNQKLSVCKMLPEMHRILRRGVSTQKQCQNQ